MKTEREIKAELRRIAKSFRGHLRADLKAAERARKRGDDAQAAHLEGNASAIKYCAEHVEHYVARMSH